MTLARALVSSFRQLLTERSSRQYRWLQRLRKQCRAAATGAAEATTVDSDAGFVAHSRITPVVKYKIVGRIATAPGSVIRKGGLR